MTDILRLPYTGKALRADLAFIVAIKNAEKQSLLPETTLKTLQSFSRKTIKNRLKKGDIQWNGKKIQPATLVNSTHGVFTLQEIAIPDRAQRSTQGAFLPVLHEDENLLVLNKANGIPSAPLHADETETAVGAALAHYPDLQKTYTDPLEPGLLHRLDTETSGILVFAKTLSEWNRLKSAWKKNQVQKHYRLWIQLQKPLPPLPYRIQIPLGHHPKSTKKMIPILHHRCTYRGKPLSAETILLKTYSKIDCSNSDEKPFQAQDLEVKITTGVMHQIRCHLASLKWPILGDTLYHGLHSTRLWLHAWRIVLPLKNQKFLEIEAPLPRPWVPASQNVNHT